MKVNVIVASGRAAAGIYEDTAGPLLVNGFREAGFEVAEPTVVPDGQPVATALEAAIAAGVDVVVTSGGTGLTSTDRTPELTGALLDREVPGIAEAIRARGLGMYHPNPGTVGTPYAMLSRGIAGVTEKTLIVNLAGSTGAAKDGLAVLVPILPHIVDQIHDGDHPRSDI